MDGWLIPDPGGIVDRLAGLVFGALVLLWMSKIDMRGTENNEDVKKDQRNTSPPRLGFFDFARGVAILCVVAIHADLLVPEAKFLRQITWFCVPLFLLSSGYLLARRYEKGFDMDHYAWSALTRIGVPYALYSILYSLWVSRHFDPLTILTDLLFGRANGGGLYFIPVILQLYLLFPLIRKAREALVHPIALGLIFLLSYAAYDYNVAIQTPAWDSDLSSLIFFGRYLFYFMAGIALSRADFDGREMPQTLPLLLMGIPLGIAAMLLPSATLDRPALYPAWMLLLLHVAYRASGRWKAGRALTGAITKLGEHSLAIYLIQGILLFNLIGPLLRMLPPLPGIVSYPAIILAALAASLALGRPYSRTIASAMGVIERECDRFERKHSAGKKN